MKIACPSCNADNETENAVAGLIQCGSCAEWFKEPAAAPPDVATQPSMFKADHTRRFSNADKIRDRAGWFETFAMLAGGFGIICLFIGLVPAGEKYNYILLTIGAAATGFALWLFLVAQIIHIRANTEK